MPRRLPRPRVVQRGHVGLGGTLRQLRHGHGTQIAFLCGGRIRDVGEGGNRVLAGPGDEYDGVTSPCRPSTGI
jgi:hypothetical protein